MPKVNNSSREANVPIPELKNMVVLDSKDTAGVIAHSGGEPPKEEPKTEVKAEAPKEEPEQEVGESDDDYAKRLGLSKEQHDGVTETIKKAVGKKHRQYKEAEEFAKHEYNSRVLAEERAAKAERELQRLKATQTPEEPTETAKPERKNFKTDDEYIDALTTYKAEQAIAKKEKEQQEKAREDVQRERAAKYDGQMAQARELVPDFQETMESVEGREDLRIPDAVSAYLFNESDKVPEVLYHLIKTPEVLESLWKMSPMRQVIEIGKIEGTLKSFGDKSVKESPKAPDADKASPTATAPSKARPPAIQPITQGSESQVSGDKDESFETAFEKYRSTKAPNILRRKRH